MPKKIRHDAETITPAEQQQAEIEREVERAPDIDLEAAAKFLELLGIKQPTFQTFGEGEERKGDRRLARIRHGALDEHADELSALNCRGAGAFVSLNKTDGKGRKRENIERIRAVMLDLDGAPLDPVQECRLKPHVIVESSPERWHCYWRVKNFALDEFEDTQRGLAKRFDGDPDVDKLTACARLPGFFHNKKRPFQTRIVETNDLAPYTMEEILAEFPPESEPHKPPSSGADALILPAGAPTEAADKFVEHSAMQGEIPLLRHYRGIFYKWSGMHYKQHPDEELECELYKFLRRAMARKPGGNVVPFNPTKSKVTEVVHALRRSALLVPGEWEAPFWLGLPGDTHEFKPAADLISCRNGILNLKTRKLLPHDPLFFTPNALAFDYDASAPEPKRFFRFLDDLHLDEQMEETLQEIFGYLLTSDTRQQKIFLIVGPRRGGKGTLVFLLEQLLGTANIVFQTLDSLTGEFGRWPLIDKKLAVFADARLSSRGSNIHRLVETLLSISGGDTQTINRKYGDFWTGRLAVRFLITTNVLPALKDASGTIASRFIMLKLTQTFYGKEDMGLRDKLLPELPGILNWSLDGLAQLRKYGHFEQPASSKESIQLMEHIAAPVQSFVAEWCETGPDSKITTKALYQAFKDWAQETGNTPRAQNMFGKELHDVVPLLAAKGAGKRRTYAGVALSEAGEAAWEELKAEKGKARP